VLPPRHLTCTHTRRTTRLLITSDVAVGVGSGGYLSRTPGEALGCGAVWSRPRVHIVAPPCLARPTCTGAPSVISLRGLGRRASGIARTARQ
jgi:hypothetical protein